MESVCQGSKCPNITTYDWILYEANKYFRNSSVIWRRKSDLQLITNTPLNSSTIVLKENSLVGDRSYRLTSVVITSDGLTGMSAYDMPTASLPSGGECSIEPPVGISLETNFTLSCSGWKSDSEPLSYQFQYQLYNGLNSVIYHGFSRSVVSRLPSGVLPNNYSFNVTATVSDNNGAATQIVNLTVQVGY